MPGTKQLLDTIVNGPIWKVEKLLNKMSLNEVNGKVKGITPLHLAIYGNYNEAVDLLVAKIGIYVNVKNIDGETPLHVAVFNNKVHAVTKILASPHVDVNVLDNDKWTPLHIACENNCHEMVSELLASPGVDINIQGKYGWTPLHLASYQNKHQVVSKVLASPGVNANVKDDYGITPVRVSGKCRHIHKQTNKHSAGGCYKETLKLLLEDARVDLDINDEDWGRLEGHVAGNFTTNQKCLKMINNERRKRVHGKLEQEPSGQGENIVTANEELTGENGGEEKEEASVATANEELIGGNGGEEKEEESVTTANEEVIEGDGGEEKVEGCVATGNEPKEEKKNGMKMMYSTLCWCCSKEDCKLYKCCGCRKARYCSDECLKEDWDVHGNYCRKQQQWRNKKKADGKEAEREMEGPLDIE